VEVEVQDADRKRIRGRLSLSQASLPVLPGWGLSDQRPGSPEAAAASPEVSETVVTSWVTAVQVSVEQVWMAVADWEVC
jgi:hypothetical protein